MFFHHFFELSIKHILRKISPIPSGDTSKKATLLHKIIKNDVLSTEEEDSLRSIEFSEALDRVVDLISSGVISSALYGFIKEKKYILENLNSARNRKLHRGKYILRYPALDEFVGGYIIPLVLNFMTLPEFLGKEKLWKYGDLSSGLDPIEVIKAEFQSQIYNIKKIAMLKEIARASYKLSPQLKGMGFLDQEERDRATLAASFDHNGYEVKTCFVCNNKSLVVYSESEMHGEEYNEEGAVVEYESLSSYTYEVKCFYCTFKINNEVGNPSDYNLFDEEYFTEF